ncbi:MAG: AAA family ATPase, partial [Methanomicrobium sp.]|nr:AAA family ATPase [Methanomicrobium sp.]
MKILKLRFSNLNSLYGEWNIDFTDSSYQNDGIFAITGPTGSGKTTIMDAICLALYGQTPRLGRISQGTNEIMSRKCGECFSEVLFESSKGRFLCHWSQKRSHLKPDGNLQSPRHEISDAATGNIMESAKNMVLKAVEDATGMDFERFTRSVMLAQGGFSAFLEADPAERSPILEQITGTEIYSRISVKVHEKTREERDKLAILNAGINAVPLLSEEEIKALSDEKEANRKKTEELSEKIRNHEKCLLWLSKISELEKEISKLENEKTAISKYSEEFSGELIRLEKAKRATELDGVYQNYINVREQAEKSKADYDAAVSEIKSLNYAISGLTEKSIQADEALNTLKTRFSEERETIEKVNSLDLRIEGEKKTFLDHKKRHDNLSDKIKKQEEKLKNLKELFAEKNQLLEIHEHYLKYNNRDKELSENLGVIKEKFSILSDAEGKISKREKHLENIINDKKKCLSLLKELSDVLELRKDECRKTETEIKEKSGELLGVLNGREPQDIIKEREELEKVIQGLQRLAEISKRETDYISQKEAISERNISVETEKNAALLVLDGLEKNIEAEERILKELEEKRLLTAKIRSLEDERGKLTEGLPCPLCGSLTHPYLDKSIKPLLNAGDEYEIQQLKINSLKESLLEIKRKTARLDAESELNDKRVLDIEKDLLKTGLEIKSELLKIGLNADENDEKRDPEYYSQTREELLNNLDYLKTV